MRIKEARADIRREVAHAATRAVAMTGARKADEAGRADIRGRPARTPGRASAEHRLASAARSCALRVESAGDVVTGLTAWARTLTFSGAYCISRCAAALLVRTYPFATRVGSAVGKATGLIGWARTLTGPGAHVNRPRASSRECGAVRVGSAVDEVTGLTGGARTLTGPDAHRIDRRAAALLFRAHPIAGARLIRAHSAEGGGAARANGPGV